MASPNAVSMSMTTALIYGLSGGFFFLLVFLLVLMGMTNCAWNCSWCRCKRKARTASPERQRIDWSYLDIEKSLLRGRVSSSSRCPVPVTQIYHCHTANQSGRQNRGLARREDSEEFLHLEL